MHGAFPAMSQAKAQGSLEVQACGTEAREGHRLFLPPPSPWMISLVACQLAHLNQPAEKTAGSELMETRRAPWATARPSPACWKAVAPAQAGAGLKAGFVLCPLRWLLQVVATSKKPHLQQGLAGVS